jgi:preprotein translocase subunit Sss1
MGLAVSLLIAAAGLVLALAVHPASEGSIDVNTVGWILFIVGLIGFVIDLLLWSSWGPGYLRRDSTYVERRVYPARRRKVVEEIDEPAGPPPGY